MTILVRCICDGCGEELGLGVIYIESKVDPKVTLDPMGWRGWVQIRNYDTRRGGITDYCPACYAKRVRTDSGKPLPGDGAPIRRRA